MTDLAAAVETYGRVGRLETEMTRHLNDWLDDNVEFSEATLAHEIELLALVADGKLAEALKNAERVAALSGHIRNLIAATGSIQSARLRWVKARENALDAAADIVSVAESLTAVPDLSGLLAEVRSEVGEAALDLHAFIANKPVLMPKEAFAGLLAFTRKAIKIHVWSIHNTLLLSIAKGGSLTALSKNEIDDAANSADAVAREFRDKLRGCARALSSKADVVLFAELLKSISEYVATLTEATIPAVASAARAATKLDRDGDPSALRPAALAYDSVREGVSFLAAGYALLLTLSTGNQRIRRRWAKASELPFGRPSDLPRTSISDVARGRVEEGADIEIAGVITDAQFTITANRNSSLLRLEDSRQNAVNLFVPFAAVNSFGIAERVWCEAHGTLHPDGKDGRPGPLLLIAREKLVDESKESFTSYLYRQAVAVFPYRQAGLSLMAGRRASERVSANEILLWMTKFG